MNLCVAGVGPSQRFWRFFTAGAVSNTGTAVTAVALPLIAVITLQSSPVEVGLLAAASYAAWLVLGLPAGVIVARLPLRGTQVVMDLVRAGAIVSVPAAYAAGSLTLVHLVLVALVVGLASVLFDVGNATFLPSVVPPEERTQRNSLMSVSHSLTDMGGPTLGGVLVQLVGAVPTLLLDTLSYLVSALLLRSLPAVPAVTALGPAPRMREQIRQGWHYVVGHPVIGRCMWAALAVNFVSGALLTLTPLYLVRTLGASPALVGVLLGTDGAGALLGATLTPRLVRRVGSARAVLVVSGGLLLSAVLLPLGAGGMGMVLFGLGNAGLAANVVVFSIITRTYRQNAAPPEMLSRVVATVRFVSWGAIPVGALLAGLLAQATSPRMALGTSVLVLAAPIALTWIGPLARAHYLEDISTARP
jgi:MFS family permease